MDVLKEGPVFKDFAPKLGGGVSKIPDFCDGNLKRGFFRALVITGGAKKFSGGDKNGWGRF